MAAKEGVEFLLDKLLGLLLPCTIQHVRIHAHLYQGLLYRLADVGLVSPVVHQADRQAVLRVATDQSFGQGRA